MRESTITAAQLLTRAQPVRMVGGADPKEASVTKTPCPTCGRDYALNLDGSLRRHTCELATRQPRLSESHRRGRERRRQIVDAYLAAPGDAKPTLAELGRMVGVTRERARQFLAAAGIDPSAVRADVYARRRLAALRAELLAAMAAAQTRPPCRVCGAWVIRRSAVATCSAECSRAWQRYKLILDADAHHRHRLASALAILAHPDRRRPSEVAWAQRMLSDDPPPPNRRYAITNRDVFAARHA